MNQATEYSNPSAHPPPRRAPDDLTRAGSPLALNHDAKGNLTDDGSHEYVYDHEHRLIEVWRKADPTGALLLTVDYGALGRVISRRLDGQ